jgi:hypothetical protein
VYILFSILGGGESRKSSSVKATCYIYSHRLEFLIKNMSVGMHVLLWIRITDDFILVLPVCVIQTDLLTVSTLSQILVFIPEQYGYPLYRVSQEECAILRESVPYVKLYRYNPKHLYPKLNIYWDNWERKLWSSSRSKYCMLAQLQNYAATLQCACPSLTALQLLPFSRLPVCARRSCHLMSGYRAISYDIITPDGWIVTYHLKCLEPKGQVQHQCEGFCSLI